MEDSGRPVPSSAAAAIIVRFDWLERAVLAPLYKPAFVGSYNNHGNSDNRGGYGANRGERK